jgi:predicted transcriptional regulator
MILKVLTTVKVLKCYNLSLMIHKIMHASQLNKFKYNFKDVPVMYYSKVLESKQPKLEENISHNINVQKSDT